MIIVSLMGGLGNQMFQYAFAKVISTQHPIVFDIATFSKKAKSSKATIPRSFEMGIFENIETKKIPLLIIKLIATINRKYDVLKLILLPPIYRRKNIVNDLNAHRYINHNVENTIYQLSGYFQRACYYDEIRPLLLNHFQFPSLPIGLIELESKILSSSSIALHVRRGDYSDPSNSKVHGLLPISYYNLAIAKMTRAIRSPFFFIFSDDVEWCKKNIYIENYPYEFVFNKNEAAWTDMYLMSICKHNIIANSSFSWWSAWLNQNPTKLIIAPKKWFVSMESEIIPDSWIKV